MHDLDEVIDQVRCTIADHLYVPVASVTSSTVLATDLGADSLDIIEIRISLESWFDIEIEADQAREFRTVIDIASWMASPVPACSSEAESRGVQSTAAVIKTVLPLSR